MIFWRSSVRIRRLVSLTGLLASLTAVGTLEAKTSTVSYAQLLVDHVIFRHTEVQAAGIYTQSPGTAGLTLAATAGVCVAPKPEYSVTTSADNTRPSFTPLNANGVGRVLISLLDTTGTDIGILMLDFKVDGPRSESACLVKAAEIRDQLQEIVPKPATLFDPYTKGSDETDTLAQRITSVLVARHPDLNVVAMHLTAPGERLNRVWGINRPNFIGRPSDEIDTDTEKTGRIVMQVILATHRMEVHMPMLDQKGMLIGTLCTVYFWHDEREAGDLYARSLGIRDEARLLMPENRADLFKP